MTTRSPLLMMSAFGLIAVGCSRPYYRTSADREAYPIIGERVCSPESAVGRTTVEPHPTSRLADPNDPDCPPKPPDDPCASRFMDCPGGNPGYRHWDKYGVTDSIEPPGWDAALGLDEKGVLKLTREKAVEVALNNSREYQTRLENVYLSALALTLNRFEFEVQWFGRNNTGYVHTGGPFETNTLATTSGLGFGRNFAAGGQLLTNFANSFVWEFTGNTHTASSSIGATLIQPLIRGFGRDIRLETLTQAERDVLYVVRDYARFRKQFWASVTVDSGGYLQLLNAVQAVRNARANVKSQEQNYALYQKLFQGGRVQAVNVDQIYQGLLSARSNVISAEINLQNALDGFKLRLGLPPRLPVELDDTPLETFRLVAPAVETLRDEIDLFERARKAELDRKPGADSVRNSFATLEDLAVRVGDVIEKADAELKNWQDDLAGPADADRTARAKAAYESQKAKPAELRETLKTLKAELAAQKSRVTEATAAKGWDDVVAGVRALAGVADTAISVQSQARIYLIRLPEVAYEEDAAMTYAKEHRLDLLTARAQVTDAWRKVNVAANALRSDLTVRADATLGTEPGTTNPLDFSASGSRFAVGLQFDGPLNRQAERNAYRASQIAYQRARRNYLAASDGVELDIRQGLRELNRLRLNFEIARQQLLVAVRQLETERRVLAAPVQQRDQRGPDDPTLRILNAQQQLLDARNNLANNLFGFEQQRVRLLLSLEVLTLDDRGFPTDDAPALPAPPPAPVLP
jgi:outer membrane protein TolC